MLLSVRMSKQPILNILLIDDKIAKCELQSRCKILLITRKGARILISVRKGKQPILGVVQLGDEIPKSELQSRFKILLTTREGA